LRPIRRNYEVIPRAQKNVTEKNRIKGGERLMVVKCNTAVFNNFNIIQQTKYDIYYK